MSLQERVASRYIQATDEAAFDALVDHWTDQFLDEVAAHTKIDEPAVESFLASKGVDADDLNAVAGMKTANQTANQKANQNTAGLGSVLKILGGLVLQGIWWLVMRPFLALGKFVVSGKFRAEVRAAFKKALNHEVRATKHIASVAGRLARGEEVHPLERKEAMKQFVSILVRVVLICLAGSTVVGLFAGTFWTALTALLGPVSEMVVVLLGGPIKAAASKLLSADIAQFPGSRG